MEKLLFRGCRGYREYREYRVCREGGGPDGPPGFYGASAQARRMPMRDNLRDNRPTLETKSLCFGVVGSLGSLGSIGAVGKDMVRFANQSFIVRSAHGL